MMEESEYYWVDAPVWDEPSEMLVPSWWRNLIFNCHEVNVRESCSPYMQYARQNEIIDREIKPFGGACISIDYKTRLRFDDESGFTAFLLRWS
jgi:hypothetical protein